MANDPGELIDNFLNVLAILGRRSDIREEFGIGRQMNEGRVVTFGIDRH